MNNEKLSIYRPLNYEVTLIGTDGKQHVLKGVHDGEDDSWYGKTTVNADNKEIAFNINIYGGVSYGDNDTDIFVNAYECTTKSVNAVVKSKGSTVGWCNDNSIELDTVDIKVSKIEDITDVIDIDVRTMINDMMADYKDSISDDMIKDIVQDVKETASTKYNMCDVRLAVQRVIADRLNKLNSNINK